MFQAGDLCKGCAAAKAQLCIQLLHPLEVIRTRLQSHDGSTRNIVPNYRNSAITAASSIFREEGLAGLYRGSGFSLLANCASQFLFFLVYNNLKHRNDVLSSSLASGVLVTLLTQPFWTIKTRLLLSTKPMPFYQSAAHLYYQHGLPGFYRGVLASLLLCTNGVIQLNFYEMLDATQYQDHSSVKYLAFLHGASAKVLASLVTYPLTTIRTRYQQDQFEQGRLSKYSGYGDILKQTWTKEGLAGFYKGIYPSLVRTVPQSGLFYFLYEFFKNNVDQCV